MENATKALLIANLSQQEVQAANEKFARYNGGPKRGSEVNALLQTVLNANLDAAAAGETDRQVEVTIDGKTALQKGDTSITVQASTVTQYYITVIYEGVGGLVNKIEVEGIYPL